MLVSRRVSEVFVQKSQYPNLNLVIETSVWRMVFPCFPYSWITCESIICILQTLNVWPKFYLHFGSLEGKLAALEILAHLLRMVMDLKELCVSEVIVGPPTIFSEFWLDAKGRYTSVSDAFSKSLRLHPTNHRGSRMRLSCWNESSIPTSWGALPAERVRIFVKKTFSCSFLYQYRNHHGTGIFTYMKGQFSW